MRDIIPNWHPIFVHFTVALLTMSVIFYWLGRFIPSQRWQHEFIIIARWCLWATAIITIITVSLGFYAYYTVAHDEIVHVVMTTHRNWAVIALVIIWLITLWSWFIYRRNKKISVFFLMALLFVLATVTVTAWYGGELVFRYGVGVMSLPKTQGHNHNHNSDRKRQHENEHIH